MSAAASGAACSGSAAGPLEFETQAVPRRPAWRWWLAWIPGPAEHGQGIAGPVRTAPGASFRRTRPRFARPNTSIPAGPFRGPPPPGVPALVRKDGVRVV